MPETNLTVTLNADGIVTVTGAANVSTGDELVFAPGGTATSVSDFRITTGSASSFTLTTQGNNLESIYRSK